MEEVGKVLSLRSQKKEKSETKEIVSETVGPLSLSVGRSLVQALTAHSIDVDYEQTEGGFFSLRSASKAL